MIGPLAPTSAAPRDEQIKRLVLPIASIMLAIAMLLLGVTFYAGQALNDTALAYQRARIDNAVTARLIRALDELRSVAWWDDAVMAVAREDPDREFMELEFGAYIIDSYHHDRVFVLDANDQPVFAYGPDGAMEASSIQAYLPALRPLIDEIRGGKQRVGILRDRSFRAAQGTSQTAQLDWKYGRFAGGVISHNGRLMLASVLTVSPSVDGKLLRQQPPLMISLIFVDAELIAELGRGLLTRDLALAAPVAARDGLFTLTSDDRRHSVQISWRANKPGQLLLDVVVPVIAAGLLLCGGVAGHLLYRLTRSARALAESERDARHIANHDAMTGLPNRRRFVDELGRRLADPSSQVAVACIDIDRFKDVNDPLGHHTGDALICAVAERLSGVLRERDFLARLGGDELAILRSFEQSNQGLSLGALISAAFQLPFDASGHQIDATASIGLALSSTSQHGRDLIRDADIALYEAKARGRNCCVVFADEMAERLNERRSIEVDLRKALTTGELRLHYQPIVDAANGRMTGVEGLLRWTHATRGPIAPDVFIAIAEDAGLMSELGRYVIDQAVSDSTRWPHLETAINVSPAQFRSATLIADLRSAVQRHFVDPRKIVLEITESVLLSADDRNLDILRTIKGSGFRVALDDFGTGYSSLSYLRDFPFDKLKIDRSFVHGVNLTQDALTIIRSVVSLGRGLGLDVVAEGVETVGEMEIMQALGCTHMQGYLFSRAVPADEVAAIAEMLSRLPAYREPSVASRA